MHKTLSSICLSALLAASTTALPSKAAPCRFVGLSSENQNYQSKTSPVMILLQDGSNEGDLWPELPDADSPYVLQGNASTTINRSEVETTTDSAEARATSLPLYEWVCKEGSPKAAVILVHGLFQHAESLAPIARHLASMGYLAISLDQRGHGFWHFKNGLGRPGYAIDYRQSIDDVTKIARVLREEHPSLPVFCLGESAGAAIAARSAAASPGLYDGLILCAFATKPRALRLLWTVEDVANNMFDWDRDIKMTRYVQRFTSEDNRVTLETMNDPMCRRGISLNELIDTCKFMKETSSVAKRLAPNLPLLIVEGQDDQVLSPKSTFKFLAHTRCQFKKLVLIPHCGHVLVSTNYIKPLVMASIDEWLNQHTPGQFATNAIVARK